MRGLKGLRTMSVDILIAAFDNIDCVGLPWRLCPAQQRHQFQLQFQAPQRRHLLTRDFSTNFFWTSLSFSDWFNFVRQ